MVQKVLVQVTTRRQWTSRSAGRPCTCRGINEAVDVQLDRIALLCLTTTTPRGPVVSVVASMRERDLMGVLRMSKGRQRPFPPPFPPPCDVGHVAQRITEAQRGDWRSRFTGIRAKVRR